MIFICNLLKVYNFIAQTNKYEHTHTHGQTIDLSSINRMYFNILQLCLKNFINDSHPLEFEKNKWMIFWHKSNIIHRQIYVLAYSRVIQLYGACAVFYVLKSLSNESEEKMCTLFWGRIHFWLIVRLSL